jgi:hypothetical protein
MSSAVPTGCSRNHYSGVEEPNIPMILVAEKGKEPGSNLSGFGGTADVEQCYLVENETLLLLLLLLLLFLWPNRVQRETEIYSEIYARNRLVNQSAQIPGHTHANSREIINETGLQLHS